MRISDIYEEYNIMPNLQLHMLRVAGVAKIICDNYKKDIEKDDVITACLIHDMGNIIREGFKFYPDSLGGHSEDYWESVQREFREKYGNDEHEAAIKIAKEIKVNPNVQVIINSFGFINANDVLEQNNIELEIATYSDHRVTPQGVVSMEKRHSDAYERHVLKSQRFDADLFNAMRGGWREIEKQIFAYASIDPDFITDEEVNKQIETLKEFEI